MIVNLLSDEMSIIRSIYNSLGIGWLVAAYKRLVLGGSGKNFSLAANILAQDNTECHGEKQHGYYGHSV